MSTIKIKAWLDSGANHDSTRWTTFEVGKDYWRNMSEEEREDYVKDHAWDRMDWGWFVVEEDQDD
jgi:hypothetical protein